MLLTVALGLLATAMAVHGGILSSNNRGHRVTFAVYGLLGLLLTIGQGVVIYTEQQESRVDRSRLQD
jgi:hypothetical protein